MIETKTEQELIEAFWKLYEEKPIEKISINNLCEVAGYNRSTFYNHFENIYSLQEKAIENIFDYAKEQLIAVENFDSEIIVNIILNNFLKNNKYIACIIKRHEEYLIQNKMRTGIFKVVKNKLKNKSIDFEMLAITIEYQIAAILGVIGYYYQNKDRITPEEIIDKLFEISSRGPYTIITEKLFSR